MQFPNILFKFWSVALIDKVLWTSIRAQHYLLTAEYFIYMEPDCWLIILAQRYQIPYSISWVVFSVASLKNTMNTKARADTTKSGFSLAECYISTGQTGALQE